MTLNELEHPLTSTEVQKDVLTPEKVISFRSKFTDAFEMNAMYSLFSFDPPFFQLMQN